MIKENSVSILGAGLVGSLLAILLQKKGYHVSVFESRNDMRKLNMSTGKSINLAMSTRGWKALEKAGLKNDIQEIAIPMHGREIHFKDSSTIYQAYGKNNEAIYSVSRGELNQKLISLAEENGAKISFNHKCKSVNIDNNDLIFKTENNNDFAVKEKGVLIGADGAFSALRKEYLKTDKYNYNQFYIEHGYCELEIPAGENGSFLLNKNALHIWPRKNFMLIALPNLDGSFTCTLFFPFKGEVSFESINSKEKLIAFFKEEFPDAFLLMPTLVEDYFSNPHASLVTVKCFPWIYKDKNFLIGDAAHAIVPFYGQGMNAGFEDCSELLEILENNEAKNWDEILIMYQEKRKINGDAVADLALKNFIEMRDLVADPIFLERKKIEKDLGLRFPEKFNSVYEMVSFSTNSYHKALQCQSAQDILLQQIMQLGNYWENIKNENVVSEISNLIDAYAIEMKN